MSFFKDLWSDLVDKRLLPVLAILIAGLIAVPVVLGRPSDSETPPPAPELASANDVASPGQARRQTQRATRVAQCAHAQEGSTMAYRGEDLDLRTPQGWGPAGRDAPSGNEPNWWTRSTIYKGGRADPIWIDEMVMACCNTASMAGEA